MSKIQYDPNSQLAEYYARTEIEGSCFTQDTLLGKARINFVTGDIVLEIRWKYTWLKDDNVSNDWTLTEKSKFISSVHAIVCHEWNGKIFYSVSGDSDFSKKFQGKNYLLI
ncbi:hypothetical protein DBY68_022225 [Pseudocitrobacter sp. RIT415]|uniref:hypothetical protein n=1 Tax=Pseudocitrobacter TaxID=1504576 RepID=UPI000D3BD39C|nr:hypothetical protein [Pseudocitrobacter sp. RIT 415]RAU40809.1 hypothetical protein DBY68_022225 [Pseudocitrobacter sp. RIT 415]